MCSSCWAALFGLCLASEEDELSPTDLICQGEGISRRASTISKEKRMGEAGRIVGAGDQEERQ